MQEHKGTYMYGSQGKEPIPNSIITDLPAFFILLGNRERILKNPVIIIVVMLECWPGISEVLVQKCFLLFLDTDWWMSFS